MSERLFRELAGIEAALAAKKLRAGPTTYTYAEGLAHKARASSFMAEADRLAAPGPAPDPVPDPPPPPPPPPPPSGDRRTFRNTCRRLSSSDAHFDTVRTDPLGPDPTDDEAHHIIVEGGTPDSPIVLDDFTITGRGQGIGAYAGNDAVRISRFTITGTGGHPDQPGTGLYPVYPQGWFEMIDGNFGQVGAGLKQGYTVHNHVGQQGRLTHFLAENIVDTMGRDWMLDEFDEAIFRDGTTNAYSIDFGYASSQPNGTLLVRRWRAPQFKFRLPIRSVDLDDDTVDSVREWTWQGGTPFNPRAASSWHFATRVVIGGQILKG